jgi:hypothetical protein
MARMGRRAVAGVVLCAGLGVGSPLAGSASAATPVPDVTGPIAATATSYPFGAADHTLVPEDLSKVG